MMRKVPARRRAILTPRELLHIARAADHFDRSLLPKRVERVLHVTWRDAELSASVVLTNGREAWGWLDLKAALVPKGVE